MRRPIVNVRSKHFAWCHFHGSVTPRLHFRAIATRTFPTTELGLKHVAGPATDFDLDLIAVHGLGAHPLKTWLWRPPSKNSEETKVEGNEPADERGINWLQDLLPLVLPKARISTFNYVSDWKNDAPHESLRNISLKLLSNLDAATSQESNGEPVGKLNTPLMFIGHSFGGLVIEKALVLAAQTAKYRQLLQRTHSTVLLGTPHRGTKAADLGVTLGYCAAALGLGADTELLKALKQDTTYVKDLVADFSILAREQNIDLLCFFELYDTQIVLTKTLSWTFSKLVVDETSGTIPGWRAIGLHADHSGLNKFRSQDDVNFQLIAAKLVDRARTAADKVSRKLAHEGEVLPSRGELLFIVPHVKNPLFTPRPEVSEKITALWKGNDSSDTDQIRFALFGLGGSGTTQRALDLAYSNRAAMHVFWVNGASTISFQSTMMTIAKSVLEMSAQQEFQSRHDVLIAAKGWLESEASGKWLLIVDGVNDVRPEFLQYIERYLPIHRGTVVFTSSTARIANVVGSPENTIELGPMSVTEGTNLFEKVSGIKQSDRSEMVELLEHLEYLPLAIAQAASYIQVRQMSVSAYLRLIRGASEQSQTAIMDSAAARYGDTDAIPHSIMTMWNLALIQIADENPRAIDLLRFLSLLGPNVPIRTLRSKSMEALKLDEDIAFHDAMGSLASYRLVIPSHSNDFDESTYRLHRLVGLRTRVSMGSAKPLMVRLALEAIEGLFPYPHRHREDINRECAGMLQHADSVLLHSLDRPDLAELRNSLKYKLDLYRFYCDNQDSTPDKFSNAVYPSPWYQSGTSSDPATPRLLGTDSSVNGDGDGGAGDLEVQNADLQWIKNWAR